MSLMSKAFEDAKRNGFLKFENKISMKSIQNG